VAYKKPFEETVTPSNLLAIERAREVTRTDDLRVYPITQRDILLAGAELRKEAEQAAMDFAALETLKYQGGKWGGKYLRAPDIFFTILEKGKGRLVRLGDIAEVRRGFTTGANEFFYLEPTGEPAPEGLVHVRNGAGWEGYLEAEFLKAVIKSPREIKTILVRPEDLPCRVFMCHKSEDQLLRESKGYALDYIDMGEYLGHHERPPCRARPIWWDLGIRQIPNVVWVKSIHDSHRQAFVSFPALVDQRLYEIHHADAKVLTSILNSFSSFLAKELHGRVNLGEGALDTAVYEANQLPVLPSSAFTSTQRQRLFAAFEQMANREIKSIFEELGLPKPNRDYSNIDPNEVSLDKVLPDRRALDEVVFEALGLMEEEQLEVYRAVVELVKTRLSRARSVRR